MTKDRVRLVTHVPVYADVTGNRAQIYVGEKPIAMIFRDEHSQWWDGTVEKDRFILLADAVHNELCKKGYEEYPKD